MLIFSKFNKKNYSKFSFLRINYTISYLKKIVNYNHLSFIFEDFLQLLVRYKDSIFKKEDINPLESASYSESNSKYSENISNTEIQEIIDNISAKIESYSNLINQNQYQIQENHIQQIHLQHANPQDNSQNNSQHGSQYNPQDHAQSNQQNQSLDKKNNHANHLNYTNSKATSDFHKEFLELQYIMASLADEIFLNIKWSGLKYWEKNMIEQRLFNSHIAGQEIFQRIDNILNNKIHRSDDLINIYLQLLAMNFRGKYNINIHSTEEDETENDRIISRYKNALLKAAYSNRDIKKMDKIFPKTYYYTIENFSKNKLKNKSLGSYIIISLLSVYLVSSFGIWEYFSMKLNHSIHNVVNKALTFDPSRSSSI